MTSSLFSQQEKPRGADRTWHESPRRKSDADSPARNFGATLRQWCNLNVQGPNGNMTARSRDVRDSEGRLRHEMENLFHQYREGRFEEGMSSPFALALHDQIGRLGTAAIDAIQEQIGKNIFPREQSLEALRALAWLQDDSTVRSRRLAIEQFLNSDSGAIRETAILSLGILFEPRAIPALRTALKVEKLPELVNDLKDLIADLGG